MQTSCTLHLARDVARLSFAVIFLGSVFPGQTGAQGATRMTVRLADQIPEYGGAFIDDQGVFNVYLTDLKAETTARRVVQLELQRVGNPTRLLHFIKGEYTYRYLASFEKILLPYFGHGVSMWTIDDRRNRFLIWVVSDGARKEILSAIATSKLPLAAIIIEQHPYAVPVNQTRSAP